MSKPRLPGGWAKFAVGGLAVSLLLLGTSVGVGAAGRTAGSSGSAGHASRARSGVSGTLRGTITSGGIDSLDPNRWYFALTWGLSNALCTTLIRYATSAGVAGTKLVPGTAELPVISDHGLVYTFKLRSGIRFSDGKPITAADIKYSFLRLMNPKVDTGTGVFFSTVAGAKTYMAGKSSTVSGITTTKSSVTFHLTALDGAFDYAVALPTTCPVPVGTAMKAITNGSLLKTYASGAFKVASYNPGRSLDLAFNKNYDQALGKRGHVAKIDFAIGVDSQASVEEIQAGQLDFSTTNIDTATIIRLSHDPALSDQTHDSSRPDLIFLFLNSQVAPLTNVDVRKAVNYAITRTEILKEWGGPLAGTATDELTPPALPDYKKYSIYPNTSDLSKAKQLMRESGVKTPVKLSMRVINTEPGFVTMGDVIKANLAPLGITVAVVGSPNSVNNSFITNPKSHTALGINPSSATFPDDEGLIGVLLTPATPDAPPNLGRFGDKAFVATFRHAAQALGQTRVKDYEKLDYKLMSQEAPWAPLLAPKWFDFVSSRLGGYVYSQALDAINYNTLSIKG